MHKALKNSLELRKDVFQEKLKEEKKQSWMEPAISSDGGDDALKTQMVRLEYC